MAITTVDNYLAAAKQRIQFNKTNTVTTIASQWYSIFDRAGVPGAGTLAGASTAAGVVPVHTDTGYPAINAWGGGNTGYLTRVAAANTAACRYALFDRLFVCGAYNFNANTTLASQPSYASRLPGTNYVNLEIWVETVTAATGNLAVNVTYTNQAGTTGRTTGAIGIGAAPTVNRCWPLGLQAGDSGVQKIENVTGSVASAGTFNVMVLRRLAEGRVNAANDLDIAELLRLGMPQLVAEPALYLLLSMDGTSSGVPDCSIEVTNG